MPKHEIPVPDPRVDMTLVVSCPDEDAEHIRLLMGRLADERDRAVESRENANAATLRAEAERDRYMQIGDEMQSEASRLAGWVRHRQDPEPLPYEVVLALVSVEGCVERWTAARTAATTERTDLDAA